jgi:hypothetical protein
VFNNFIKEFHNLEVFLRRYTKLIDTSTILYNIGRMRLLEWEYKNESLGMRVWE